jgi:hypothetical protein
VPAGPTGGTANTIVPPISFNISLFSNLSQLNSTSVNPVFLGGAGRIVQSGDGSAWTFTLSTPGSGAANYGVGAIVFEVAGQLSNTNVVSQQNASANFYTGFNYANGVFIGSAISINNVQPGDLLLNASTIFSGTANTSGNNGPPNFTQGPNSNFSSTPFYQGTSASGLYGALGVWVATATSNQSTISASPMGTAVNSGNLPYINALLDLSFNGTVTNLPSGGTAWIGGQVNDATQYFQGTIADLSIFPSALNANQIANLYSTTSTIYGGSANFASININNITGGSANFASIGGSANFSSVKTNALTGIVGPNAILNAPFENVIVSNVQLNGATASLNIAASSYYYYTTNPSGTYTINIVGPGALMSTGQSVTVAFLVLNGSNSAFYPTSFLIDGLTTTSTFYWQGGNSPPTAANVSAIDSYSFTIIKTAATPAYTILAAQTKF